MDINEGNEFQQILDEYGKRDKWQKDCDCQAATAKMPDITFEVLTDDETGSEIWHDDKIRYRLRYHPGPVCQGCQKPWRLIDDG